MRSFLTDVNVWVALSWARHVHYEAAHVWFDELGPAAALFCRLTQLGFLRMLTNRAVMREDLMSEASAWSVYDRLCDDERVSFVSEPFEMESAFRLLTRSQRPGGTRWTDAYLAALARTRGLAIATFDRAFRSFPGVETLILRPS